MQVVKSVIVVVFTLSTFIFFPKNTIAQFNNVTVGDKVRINAPTMDTGRIVGTVREVSSSGILLSTGDAGIMIPYNAIDGIQISKGQKSRWGLGGALGIVPGAIGGALFTEKRCNREVDPCYLDFTGLENMVRVTKGMLIGMTLGSIIGASIKTDRWEKVPVSVSMGVSPTNTDEYSLKPVITLKWSLGSKR